ncbi:MAG: hypothetical protein NXI30_19040 [bacterium]|nr:hypothetical protein [bacterium]
MPVSPVTVRRIRCARLFASLATWVAIALAPTSALGESSLALRAGHSLEAIGATTFDERGRAIGHSSFEAWKEDDGSHRMKVTMGTDAGGRNVSQAVLAPVAGGLAGAPPTDGLTLRVVEERSQSTTAEGRILPLLVIDHRAGRVSCYDEGESESGGRHVDIEGDDRVVNVPMQLLFDPLVRGDIDAVHFQIAACNDGPVLHDMIAVRGKTRNQLGRKVVEIEYGPDFGKTVAWLASRLLPSFSFWFDADTGAYLGHRMPLHRKGPEITLVRQGLTLPEIGIQH